MSWKQEYYDRVRPVVGEALFSRRLAVWDLGHGYLAAEALARTGLRQQVWFDDSPVGGAFSRSLGLQFASFGSRHEALARVCREHNEWETDWDLRGERPDAAALRRLLEGRGFDLLLAAGDDRSADVARAAVATQTPLVMTFALARGTTVQVVWVPEAAVDPEQIVTACERLAALPRLDLDGLEAHVEGLEARSMALALARWILSRGERPETARDPREDLRIQTARDPREDLRIPIIDQGRALVLRGQPAWPWSTRFLSPGQDLAAVLQGLGSGANAIYRPPLALLRNQRLLVLGLGTASLLCAEAALVASHIVVVDGKDVSVHNPVRQIYGTRDVGRPKARALAEILRQRLDPTATWSASQQGEVHYLQSGRWTLGSARLHLTAADPDSEDRFAALLDQVQPTLVVVGMGRTHDDNFLATDALRRRGIRHITPSAFPGVTHYKHILTDGSRGPCYDCLQGHLLLDTGPGPTLTGAQRELFYGGTQPATLAETYPSAHSLLHLTRDLALPPGARPAYLAAELSAERGCFVGANRAERDANGQWLYGADRPFDMVTYGVDDLVPGTGAERACSCGRVNRRA